MRILLLFLALLLVWFQWLFWFGKNGYLDREKVRTEIAQLEQQNQQLSQRNQIIAAEIKDLKEGVDAIEERARSQYEMIKPNETFYRVTKEQK